jgi:hypothetical protein
MAAEWGPIIEPWPCSWLLCTLCPAVCFSHLFAVISECELTSDQDKVEHERMSQASVTFDGRHTFSAAGEDVDQSRTCASEHMMNTAPTNATDPNFIDFIQYTGQIFVTWQL